MRFADAPAVVDDTVARFPLRVAAISHGASEVDPRHHWKLAYHRPLAGDGQAILVVQCRPIDTDGDITFRQLRFVDLLNAGTVAGIILLNENSVKHSRLPGNGLSVVGQVRAPAMRGMTGMLCGTFKWNLPAGKYKYGRMAVEGASKHFCALDTEVYTAVLNGRDGRLRNARKFGQLALAQFLEFAQNTDGLTHRDLHSFFCGTKFFHFMASCNRGR